MQKKTIYFFERIRILKYRHGLQARASGAAGEIADNLQASLYDLIENE
jgi:hypothetical protein